MTKIRDNKYYFLTYVVEGIIPLSFIDFWDCWHLFRLRVFYVIVSIQAYLLLHS